MNKSYFVAFEGLNASGKSSLIKHIRETYLDLCGLKLFSTREPGGTELGESIRQHFHSFKNPSDIDAHTELLLLNVSRRDNIKKSVKWRLADGGWIVLTDRYIASTYAYQHGVRGMLPQVIKNTHDVFCEELYPDLTIYMDIPPEDSYNRSKGRGDFEQESQCEFFRERFIEKANTLSSAYKTYGRKVMDKNADGDYSEGVWHSIDATLTKGFVRSKVVNLIEKYYKEFVARG